MVNHKHYRITCSWKLSGTDTLRLASAKFFGFYGTNLQNPSPYLMASCVADPGCVLIQRDQSGAEALVVAFEAEDGRFRELFKNNIKPHTYLALQLFVNKFRGAHEATRYLMVKPSTLSAYQEWKELNHLISKKSEREYFLGKKCIHAKNYDMGPKTFQLSCLETSEGTIALSHAEAKSFLQTHEQTFPEILELQARIRATLAAGRTLRNLFGYPRYFGGIWNEALLRKAYAFVPQSTIGTITNLAFTELYEYARKNRLPWKILNNKHDSVLLQVPDTKEHREHAALISGKAIERELVSTTGIRYQMKSELQVGYNWAKYHETKNPNGMKEVE